MIGGMNARPLSSITALHWQPALRAEGEVVEGLRDIDQAIRLILATPLESDPHRPDFGSKLHLYLDWPVNRVTPYLVRESVDAIRKWEPRVQVIRVGVQIDASHITLRVQWRVAGGAAQSTEVTRGRSA